MYYSVDDILCEDHQVECQLHSDLYMGQFLDPEGCDGEIMEAGHRMKLPFWMAKSLAELESEGQTIATLELLEMFEEDFQNGLIADPLIINLNNQSQYYYELGFKFAQLFPEEVNEERFKGSRALKDCLLHAFQLRSLEIAKQAKQEKSSIEYQKVLTKVEKGVYNSVHGMSESYKDWEHTQINRRQRGQANKRLKI